MQQDNRKKHSGKQPPRKQTKQKALDHLWHFESMDRVNRALQGTSDLEQVMKDVLDALLAVFECDRAWLVHPCDPESPTWQVPMERTRPEYPGVLPVGVELPLDPVGAEVYRILRNTDGPVKFGVGEKYPVPVELATAFNVQSFIAMAFYPKTGKPWSFGLHQCSYARVWTLEEERLFRDVGRRLADALSALLAFRNLQESETQVRQLIEASPVAMAVSWGAEERVEWVNDKFIELFGYTIEDMPDVEHWWSLAYPDEAYREKMKRLWSADVEQAMREKSRIKPMEGTVRCKDGSNRHIEFRFSSIGEKHIVTFVDLTERKQVEDTLYKRERHSQSLLRLSRKLEQVQTYADVLNVTHDEVREIIGYQNIWVYRVTEDKKYAHAMFAGGAFENIIMSEDGTATLTIQDDRLLEEIVEAREIVVVEDAQTDDRVNRDIVTALGNRTIVNVPIFLFDRHLGSIGMGTFGDEGVRIPTTAERDYLMALASHMAVTLDRIHLFEKRKQADEALHERERHSQSLLRLSRKLEQAQAYSDVLNAAQDEVRETVGYQNLWAYLFTPDKKQANALFAKGPMSDRVMSKDGTATITIQGDRMMEEFIETKEIQVIEDAQTDERTDKEIAARMGNRTLVHVPILLFDRHLGSVGMGTFGDEGVRVPTASEREYLIALASHMAVTFDRIHLFDQRRQSEQALRENEEKFRTLIEQSAEGVILADENGTIVEWNHACERMMGLKQSQVLGQPLWDIMVRLIAPERTTEERRESIKSGILDALHGGRSPLFEAPIEMEFYPLPGREKRYFHQTIFPIKTEKGYRIASLIKDFTERKQMAEALAEKEREFRTLAENSPDNIARYDVNCRTIYINPALEKTLGRPVSEMLGTTPMEVALIDENRKYQEKIAKVLETGKDDEMDLVLPDRRDGVRYHNIRFVPERGADGAITGVQTIGRDITERKRAELQLLASEQLFRALVENSPDFIARYDREFRRIYVNPAIQKLFEVPVQNVLGKTPSDQSPVFAPQIYTEHLKRVIDTAIETSVEMPYRTANGEMHWGHMRFVPEFGVDGQVDSVLAIGRDIHEIKENERRFRMLAENFPDLVMRFDRDGRYIYVNPAFERVFGVSVKTVMGKTLREIPQGVKNEEKNTPFEWVRRVIDEGVASESDVCWSTEGGERVFENRYVPEKDATGNVITVLCIARDVTEQKRAEMALSNAHLRLGQALRFTEALLSAIPTPVFYKDREGRYLGCNRAFSEIMGVTPEATRGKTVFDLWPGEHAATYHAKDMELISNPGRQAYEYIMRDKDGRERQVIYVKDVFYDENDQVAGIVGAFMDITERKLAEEELWKSSQMLKLVLGNMPAYVFWKDRNSVYLGCNHLFAANAGLRSPEEIAGLTDLDLPWKHTEAESYRADDRMVMETSVPKLNYEETQLTADGYIMAVRTSKIPLRDPNGDIIGVLGTFEDITERKRTEEALQESEERLRQITSSLREVVWLRDAQTRQVLYVNPAFQEITGRTCESFYENRDVVIDAVHPDDREEVAKALEQRSSSVPFDMEHRIIHLNGSVRWVSSKSFAVRNEAGEVYRWATIMEDITERRQAEEEIRKLNQELEQRVADRTAQLAEANKELEAFAYSVSHDLRAPLRHIDGFIELLQKRTKTTLDEKSLHYMDVIADSARQMGTLIDDLLAFSRMSRAEMFKSQVDLNELVQDVIREFMPEIEGRNIEWQISPLPRVTCDRAMLRVALMNLVSNALKFTQPRDAARIEIGCEKDDRTEVILFIRDNGVGFDMNYADKLFGVFQRLHRQEDFEGTGIGLANVRRIISRHGGKTWAEGEVDHGAVFYFSLPISK